MSKTDPLGGSVEHWPTLTLRASEVFHLIIVLCLLCLLVRVQPKEQNQ